MFSMTNMIIFSFLVGLFLGFMLCIFTAYSSIMSKYIDAQLKLENCQEVNRINSMNKGKENV